MVHRTFAHTVVVGYDGSPGSVSALEWAAQDARLRRARLHVINVREPLPFVAAPFRRSTPEEGEPLLHDAELRALEVAPDVEVRHEVSEGPKHAAGGRLDVRVTVDDESVCVVVSDDGCGVDPERATGGLVNLAERAATRGGAFEILPEKPQGTRLRWSVPR